MKSCTYPGCELSRRVHSPFCDEHTRAAAAWLKEQRALSITGEQGLDAVLTYRSEPGGPTYPWADWDWDDRFGGRPDDFGDWDNIEQIA